MFGKETEKLKSFLGAKSEFKGELASDGILRLDGTVTGKIEADQIILSDTAVIKGDVIAKKIFVSGNVEGILRAEDLVEIRSKGKVKGEIITGRFLVLEGGEFNGRIRMNTTDEEPATVMLQPSESYD